MLRLYERRDVKQISQDIERESQRPSPDWNKILALSRELKALAETRVPIRL